MDASKTLHVVLVEPEIHWNTGNAGRTCLSVGAQLHLVEPLGFSLDDRYLKRAGLDYWPRVKPRVWPNWAAFAAELDTGAFGEAFFFTSGAQRALWDVRFPRPCALVFGRESVGLDDALLHEQQAKTVGIPMAPESVRSLNLSTAVGIGVFEVLRQWRTEHP